MKEIILVTGGLGFIGNKLVNRLKEKFPDKKIVILDQYIMDFDDYVRSDITDYGELHTAVKRLGGKISYIIHAASEVGRLNGEEHPWKMTDSCVKGTLNLINIAMEHEAKMLYFSTSETYGDLFDTKTVNEEDTISPFSLTNIYAISKLFGESLVKHYVENYALNAITVRPFMVYGPGVHASKYKSALDIFIWNLLQSKEISVHKDSVRSWCHIDDFIQALTLIIEEHKFKDNVYEVYNVGNNLEYKTMEELSYLICSELKEDKNLINVVDFDGEFKSQKKYFSAEKLENLGFKPKVSIEQGIKQLITWHKNLLEEKI